MLVSASGATAAGSKDADASSAKAPAPLAMTRGPVPPFIAATRGDGMTVRSTSVRDADAPGSLPNVLNSSSLCGSGLGLRQNGGITSERRVARGARSKPA